MSITVQAATFRTSEGAASNQHPRPLRPAHAGSSGGAPSAPPPASVPGRASTRVGTMTTRGLGRLVSLVALGVPVLVAACRPFPDVRTVDGDDRFTERRASDTEALAARAVVERATPFGPVLSQAEPHQPKISLDHVVLVGPSLSALEEAFVRLGFSPQRGGTQRNSPTRNALVTFEDGTYLELLAPVDSVTVGSLDPVMAANAGPTSWSIRSGNVGDDLRRMGDQGVEVRGPMRFGRTRPDGVQLAFDIGFVGGGSPGRVLPFLIEDISRREDRVPPPREGAERFTGIAAVVIAVADLNSTVVALEKVLGLGPGRTAADPELGGLVAWWAGAPVIVVSPEAPGWLADRIERFGDGVVGVVLAPRAEGGVASQLPGDRTSRVADGVIWIDPRRTHGWLLGIADSAGERRR